MKVLPIKIKTIVNHVYCPNCGHHSTFTYTNNIFKNIVCENCGTDLELIDKLKNNNLIFRHEVFDCDRVGIGASVEECIKMCRNEQKIYISFNGYVFNIDEFDPDNINYAEAECEYKQLINNIYFTSDTRFDSKDVFKLTKRPFTDTDEMNYILVNNWNEVVKENDIVYHLGDFGNLDFVRKLNGHIILIRGDFEYNMSDDELLSKGFARVYNEKEIDVYNVKLFLSHKPNDIIKNGYKNGLFGHILGLQKVKRFGLNVSVDAHDFYPVSVNDVMFYLHSIKDVYDNEILG